MFDYRRCFVSLNTSEREQLFINSVTLYAYDAADVMDDNNYATVLDSYVTTSSLPVAKVRTEKVPGLDHSVLAKRWGISSKKAMNTICWTTQHGVHTVLHPMLLRWFRTNDHHLRYRRLPHNAYSDTLFATTVSSRGNRCAQILATNLDGHACSQWSWNVKPTRHSPFFFQQDGVPPTVICDNAKEMDLGKFKRKLKEASCHLKQMEPFTPCSNTVKREIK